MKVFGIKGQSDNCSYFRLLGRIHAVFVTAGLKGHGINARRNLFGIEVVLYGNNLYGVAVFEVVCLRVGPNLQVSFKRHALRDLQGGQGPGLDRSALVLGPGAHAGEEAAPAELENGMLLTLDPEYDLLETWPAQIAGATLRTQSNPGGTEDHGDLCGLYLQVLEDLWKDDSGLHGDITYISVYLDEAPGDLTDGEKAAVAWIFAGRHNAEGLRLGFQELKAQGYVNEQELFWKDGVLLQITQSENKQSTANKISFNAEKWRSGTGAIFYTDCTAERGKGAAWEPYRPGGFAIS